jgi:hypothetical protein
VFSRILKNTIIICKYNALSVNDFLS